MKLLLTLTAFIISSAFIKNELHEDIQPNAFDVKNKIEYDFSVIKIDHVRSYVKDTYKYAVRIKNKHNVPVPVTLAIACLESGYGRSFLAKNQNNHLGIRNYRDTLTKFMRFEDKADCFEYLDGLLSRPRYAPLKNIKTDNNRDWVIGLHKCGYNNKEKYISEVMGMIRFAKLDQIFAKV